MEMESCRTLCVINDNSKLYKQKHNICLLIFVSKQNSFKVGLHHTRGKQTDHDTKQIIGSRNIQTGQYAKQTGQDVKQMSQCMKGYSSFCIEKDISKVEAKFLLKGIL